jgi:tetratricopeptide (TPR) repeat protein
MIGSLVAVLMIGLAGAAAQGQPADGGTAQGAVRAAENDAVFPGKPELLRRIALYEAAERSAEASHLDVESMAKIYSNLAALYVDAGMYPKSEESTRRWISLLRNGPQDELAEAIGHLAVLHIAMGDVRAAEKDDLEALRIRENVGEAMGTALTWCDLADVYIKQRNFKKALDYAQRAMAVLADDPKVDVADRIGVRQTLAYALCGLKQCGRAIPMLKDAVELEKASYGENSLLTGTGWFLLGYAYWQNGDMANAAEWMGRETARMKIDLGWGHVLYVNAISQYAKFLRQWGQVEEAASAEREVRRAQSVVDARTLTTAATAFVGAAPQ